MNYCNIYVKQLVKVICSNWQYNVHSEIINKNQWPNYTLTLQIKSTFICVYGTLHRHLGPCSCQTAGLMMMLVPFPVKSKSLLTEPQEGFVLTCVAEFWLVGVEWRYSTHHQKTRPDKPIVFVVSLVFFLHPFVLCCFTLAVFYTK